MYGYEQSQTPQKPHIYSIRYDTEMVHTLQRTQQTDSMIIWTQVIHVWTVVSSMSSLLLVHTCSCSYVSDVVLYVRTVISLLYAPSYNIASRVFPHCFFSVRLRWHNLAKKYFRIRISMICCMEDGNIQVYYGFICGIVFMCNTNVNRTTVWSVKRCNPNLCPWARHCPLQ